MYAGEILSQSGVEILISYEGCCGMPQLVKISSKNKKNKYINKNINKKKKI